MAERKIKVADACDVCNGTGKIELPKGQVRPGTGETKGTCKACGGSGIVSESEWMSESEFRNLPSS
jgi:DnaJ-class molecular chaperone